MPASHDAVLARIESLYHMLFAHSGYGEMSIEIRYLRKNEKEVLIRCGKQYRFVVPCDPDTLTEEEDNLEAGGSGQGARAGKVKAVS